MAYISYFERRIQMKRTIGNSTYDLETSQDKTFSGSSENRKRAKPLYSCLRNGCTEQAGTPEHYRLFFLLKGEVHLKTAVGGDFLLYSQELILLPAGTDISCLALNDAGYIIINCDRFKSGGNMSYWEKLKEYADEKANLHGAFPLRDKLGKALGDFASYSVRENGFISVYDAIFVVMRMLYTPEEMFTLFLPILRMEMNGATKCINKQ